MALDISAELLEVIVCPECHGDLLPVERTDPKDAALSGDLVCQACGLAYPVRDDIPVLLVDRARRPD